MKLALLLAALVLAIAVAGCGSSSSPEQDAQARSVKAAAERTERRAEAHDRARAHRAVRRVKSEMRGFAGTSWYSDIAGYELHSGTLFVKTDMFSKPSNEQLARQLCGAVATNGAHGLDMVQVWAANDDLLATCQPF